MPFVSFCIPVYERFSFVKDAISSAIIQDYPKNKREIILCDDGSTKGFYNHIKEYSSLIRYIKHHKNLGVSSARNTCINESKGDYIAFLDSDDIWLPQKTIKQINFMVNNNLSISHTSEYWFKNGKWINQGSKHIRYGGKIFTKVLDMCRVSPSSLIIKKDLGYFDENLRVCEDYEFILRMSLDYEIGYLDEKLLIKRAITNDQLSSNINHIESIRYNILKNFADNYKKMPADYKIALEKELKRKKEITKDR